MYTSQYFFNSEIGNNGQTDKGNSNKPKKKTKRMWFKNLKGMALS